MSGPSAMRPIVITAADDGYLPYLACFLASLGNHPLGGEPATTWIVHRGIAGGVRRELEGLTRGKVFWVEPDPVLLRRLGAPPALADARPHYFRLLAPYVLGGQARALYLDADTMVRGDLATLWSCNLDGRVLAAVRDYLSYVKDGISNWEELGLRPDAGYFNSGVMVMDLERWRAEELPRRVLEICQANVDQLWAQGRWPQHDQYGLNVVAHCDWQELEHTWNYGSDLPFRESQIVHFVGNGKVGLSTCRPEFERFFLDTLRRTPFAGCRMPAEVGQLPPVPRCPPVSDLGHPTGKVSGVG